MAGPFPLGAGWEDLQVQPLLSPVGDVGDADPKKLSKRRKKQVAEFARGLREMEDLAAGVIRVPGVVRGTGEGGAARGGEGGGEGDGKAKGVGKEKGGKKERKGERDGKGDGKGGKREGEGECDGGGKGKKMKGKGEGDEGEKEKKREREGEGDGKAKGVAKVGKRERESEGGGKKGTKGAGREGGVTDKGRAEGGEGEGQGARESDGVSGAGNVGGVTGGSKKGKGGERKGGAGIVDGRGEKGKGESKGGEKRQREGGDLGGGGDGAAGVEAEGGGEGVGAKGKGKGKKRREVEGGEVEDTGVGKKRKKGDKGDEKGQGEKVTDKGVAGKGEGVGEGGKGDAISEGGQAGKRSKGSKVDDPGMQQERDPEGSRSATAGPSPASHSAPSSLLAKMRGHLAGGRFRSLNEALYTRTGAQAAAMMAEDPGLFDAYHQGYRSQVEGWEENPLDVAIRRIRGMPKGSVVGDFGCGDARLAASVPHRVHSFDLVAKNSKVVACNIGRVPLPNACLDAAVLCLSLMGTDYGSFLEEARRTLKQGGLLWIAEVRSRFALPDERSGLAAFRKALTSRGFEAVRVDASNRMFVVVEARRGMGGGEGSAWPALKACEYKRR